MSKIIEIFPNQKAAQKAYEYAIKCGYVPSDITVIMADNKEKSPLINEENQKTLEDVGHGGAIGGSIGGLLGMIAALGANIIIPGIGLIIAGPLAGVVVGTLMGTLLALGISESQASEYADAINSGKIILCIDALENIPVKEKWAEIKKNS